MTMPEHDTIRLLDIYTTVVRTETKVNAIEAQLPDHEARLRGLERFRWTLAGFGIAAGAVSGWLSSLIMLRHG